MASYGDERPASRSGCIERFACDPAVGVNDGEIKAVSNRGWIDCQCEGMRGDEAARSLIAEPESGAHHTRDCWARFERKATIPIGEGAGQSLYGIFQKRFVD